MNKKGREKQKNCIFPFKYEGKTYNKCTKDNSENGKSWCAFKVNRAGVAVNGKWADCNEGCPGLGKFGLGGVLKLSILTRFCPFLTTYLHPLLK